MCVVRGGRAQLEGPLSLQSWKSAIPIKCSVLDWPSTCDTWENSWATVADQQVEVKEFEMAIGKALLPCSGFWRLRRQARRAMDSSHHRAGDQAVGAGYAKAATYRFQPMKQFTTSIPVGKAAPTTSTPPRRAGARRPPLALFLATCPRPSARRNSAILRRKATAAVVLQSLPYEGPCERPPLTPKMRSPEVSTGRTQLRSKSEHGPPHDPPLSGDSASDL